MANRKKSSKAKRAKGKARTRAPAVIAPHNEMAEAIVASGDAPSARDVAAVDNAPTSLPVTMTADALDPSASTPPATSLASVAHLRDRTPPRDAADSPHDPHTPQREVGDLTAAAPATPSAPVKGPSPLRFSSDSCPNMDSHTLDSVRGYVRQDLLEATEASVEDWLESFLGVPPAFYHQLSEKIGQAQWFKDPAVFTALERYSVAQAEAGRYKPAIDLFDRILDLARATVRDTVSQIPAIADELSSFPIEDVHFMNSSNYTIRAPPEQGAVAAKRKPDIVLIRKRSVPTKKHKVCWTDVLTWFELKFGNTLTEMFNTEAASRGVQQSDAGSGNGTGDEAIQAESGGPEYSTGDKRPHPEDDDNGSEHSASKGHTDMMPLKLVDPRDRDACLDVVGGPAALQSGSYALESLGSTYGTRTRCFGIVIKDELLYLWYYDACGIIYTKQALSLLHDFEKFAAVVISIAGCTPERFGAFPMSILKPPSPYPQAFPPSNLSGNSFIVDCVKEGRQFNVRLISSLTTSYSLTGRRSFIYVANISPGVDEEESLESRVIVKFSYQAAQRAPEQKIIERATDAGVDHLPVVHAWRDLMEMKDSARVVAMRVKQRKTNISLAALEKELANAKNAFGLPLYEDRIFRAIVYPQYRSIRTLFVENFELIPIMVNQMIDCLHDLRFKAKILHRDVSINNIMYEIRDGRYYFILIDFDMAVYLGDVASAGSYRASSKNRTGTLPFMAAELILDAANAVTAVNEHKEWIPIPHYVRHDFESLFHVSYWSATGIERPDDPESLKKALADRAKKLETGTLEGLAHFKKFLCMEGLAGEGIELSPRLDILVNWFCEWSKFLRKVYTIRTDNREKIYRSKKNSKRPPAYDDETINGHFTAAKLKAALKKGTPKGVTDKVTNPQPDLKAGTSKAPAKATKASKRNTSKKEPAKSKPTAETQEAENAKAPKKKVWGPEEKSEQSKQYCSRLRSRK